MKKYEETLNNLDLIIAIVTAIAWFTLIPTLLFILLPSLTQHSGWVFAGCMVTGSLVFWTGWSRWKCRLSS